MDRNNVKDIMIYFNEALKNKDYVMMTECILAMREISPEFVDVMLAAYEEEEEE